MRYWWIQSLYVVSCAYWLFKRTYKGVANEWILYFHSKILYLWCTGILTALWSDWSSIDRSTGVWIGLEPYWWWRFFQLWQCDSIHGFDGWSNYCSTMWCTISCWTTTAWGAAKHANHKTVCWGIFGHLLVPRKLKK